jgi:protocatechuate 3,4-dioxygenase beta subunit
MATESARSRIVVGALIVSLIAVMLSLWLVNYDPTPLTPEDREEHQTRVDDRQADLTAAAAEVLAQREEATGTTAVDDEGSEVHRRAANTHCVANLVDGDSGLAVADARVEFFKSHLLKSVWQRETLFARAPVAIALSESDGSVWLPKTLRGVLHVDVAGPTYHSTGFVRIELPGGEVTPAVVEAALGGQIHGRVMTRSLEPVAPARVMAMPTAGAMIDVMQGAHLTLRTASVAADGSYELHGVPVGTGWRVAALDGTFWPSTSDGFGILAGEDVAVDVMVMAARTLFGRVRNRSGKPIADAVVSYTTKAPPGLDGYDLMTRYAASRRQTWTDSAGRFALPGVPAAIVKIWAVHDQHGASARQSVDLRPARLPDVQLVLDSGACVRGRVVDNTGRAIAAAEITWLGKRSKLRPPSREEQTTTTSQTDGSFFLPCPTGDTPTAGNILVRRRGFARAIQAVEVPSSIDVEVVLLAGRAISGLVQATATGKAVTEFTLLIDVPKAARGLGRVARDPRAMRFRSKSGQFVTATEFGGTLELTVEAPGFDSTKMTVNLDEGTDEPLLFELAPTLLLAGQVVDQSGNAITNATVEASDWQMVGFFQLNATMDAQRTKTDASGQFKLPDVRPSKDKYLHVDHDDYLPLHNQRVRANDGAFQEQRIVLRSGGSIAGIVATSSGVTCREHEVVCISTTNIKGSLHRTTTDGAGNYRIEQLDPKLSYDLAILPPGTAFDIRQLFASIVQRSVGITAGKTTRVDLTFDDSGNSTVRGSVTYRSGIAVAGATVMLLDDGATDSFGLAGSRRAETNPNGQFEIHGVAAGKYVVTFGELSGPRNNSRSGQQSITVVANQASELDLIIETGELRGIVKDVQTGQPVKKVRVFVQAADTRGSAPHNNMLMRLQSRRTDVRGEFAFRSLPPGAYRLLALPPQQSPYAGSTSGVINVGPDGSVANTTIELSRGVLLRVGVHDRDGPVAGAKLILRSTTGLVPNTASVTAKDGTLELRSIPAGSYQALVQHKMRKSSMQVVRIPATGTVQLEFVLPH